MGSDGKTNGCMSKWLEILKKKERNKGKSGEQGRGTMRRMDERPS